MFPPPKVNDVGKWHCPTTCTHLRPPPVLVRCTDHAARLAYQTLEALRQAGAPSFLTVLKRFGPCNPAPMSFPIPGWTLAVDVPAAVPGLLEVLDWLDEEVCAARGRVYLTKDSRMHPRVFSRMYPAGRDWHSLCLAELSSQVFWSAQAQRLSMSC